jgi:hypothetical protein
VTGVLALNAASVARNACPNHLCTSQSDVEAARNGKTMATVSTVSFGAGLAALAAAAYFWLRPVEGTPARTGVWVAPEGDTTRVVLAVGGLFQ